MKYFTKSILALMCNWSIVCISTSEAQLWTYDFSDSTAFSKDWISGGDNDGTEVWKWSNDPSAPNAGQVDFAATTASNGFAVFNSDGNGQGILHNVTLTTTDPIDLSSANSVFIQFESQYYFHRNASMVFVDVSIDGVNFTSYPILLRTERRNDEIPVETVIVELPEAANQSQVWLQFRWDGQYEYNWKIDDISLHEKDPTPPIKFSIDEQFIFYPPGAYAQPFDQIDTDTMVFAANVINQGQNEITNVVLKAEVTDESNAVLYSDSTTIDSIGRDVSIRMILPGLWAPGKIGEGTYTIHYETYSLDVTDPDMSDNVWQENFIVTNNLYSKEDGATLATRPGFQGDYYVGNCYETSNSLIPGSTYMGEVNFVASIRESDGPFAGRKATVIIGKINDDVVDRGWNGFDENADIFSNDGIQLLAFAEHTLEGERFDTQTVPVKGAFDDLPVLMEPGTRYVVGIQYSGDDNIVRNAYSDEIDYHQVSTILYTSQWFIGGFGPNRAAVIRLTTTMDPSSVEDTLPNESITVFPNPTSDKLNLDIDLRTKSAANILVADLSGKILAVKQFDNLQNGTQTFDVSDFANGIYLVRLVTEEGSRTIKFSVQK